MSDLPTAQRQALESWATQAIAAGWLGNDATATLATTTTAAPSQLFDQPTRPLVAGLFGGTGVGKSSLLNRLAGEPIARASAERPTSRDITVYVHRSVSVDKLPDSLPMNRMRTALHNNDRYRHVMFVDMPDFDSVEVANRKLVDLWLPHLDVVLYVVSPDRYRDDQGWRLLLEHVHQHAWLFIMNHWDKGDPLQLDDFRTQLAAAGLADPVVFRSDCSGAEDDAKPVDDDFTELQNTLVTLSDRSIVESLDEHGTLARLKSLKAVSDQWLIPLNNDEALECLGERWRTHWQHATTDLRASLTHRLQLVAAQYADEQSSWLSRLRSKRAAARVQLPQLSVVDDALLERLDNTLEDFLNRQAQDSGLPLEVLKLSVVRPYTQSRQRFAGLVDTEISSSLALPGNPWQRGLYKTLGILCVVLPLASMGWIAWRVVNGFVDGGSNPAAYLGSNFAINGSLLLALSWLIPAYARHRVRPSTEQAARRGIERGLDAANLQTQEAVADALATLGNDAQKLRSQYDELWSQLAQPANTNIPDTVRRMLASEISEPVQRSLDVRANTQSSTLSTPVS